MRVTPHHTADQLAALIRAEPRAKVARRLAAVRLALLGRTAPGIAAQVLLSDRQVRTWVARYNAGGAEALADRPGRGRQGPLTAAQQQGLTERLRAGPTPADGVWPCAARTSAASWPRSSACCGRYKPPTTCSTAWASSRCGRGPGIPRPTRRGKRRLKKLPRLLAAVAAAHPGERVELWFEDEARFGQQGTLTAVWAERGSRPAAPKQVGYANVHVLTAACPASGQAEGLVSQRLDAGVVQLFLDRLSAAIPAGVRVVLAWDGAGWHTAARVVAPANITLAALPPYSPELNPVERLWHYLREHHWSNRVYRDAEELEEAAVAGWQEVCLDPNLIRTVCRCEYARPGS